MADQPQQSSLASKTEHPLVVMKDVLGPVLGWPSTGGVWIFTPTEESWAEYNKLPVTEDVDVHCRNLERFGATFYPDPEQCEEVRRMQRVRTSNEELL